MAPVLGGACKELLNRSEVKRILFDLSVVEEISTAAIGTLMRFKNTIVHLEKSMSLVVGPKLRGQLERALIDEVFDLRDNIYFLVGEEIRFMEKAKVKGGSGKGVEGRFSRSLSWLLRFVSTGGRTLLAVLLGTMVGQIALAQTHPFPSLAELEQMLAEAPDLRAIEVEMERQRMEESWGNQVFVYANHSQSFSSFVPFVPLNDFGVAGGTTVGVSVSVTLDRLLGKPTPADLDQRLKVLEYERLFQEKLVSLRTLFRQREKLISHLEYLQMQRRTADLQLEKVQIGLSLVNQVNGSALPFVFDPIDLAQAEERVERIKSERRQTELDIENRQTEILGLLGKGRIGP
jgi:anti-anti-sigma regulatory factor